MREDHNFTAKTKKQIGFSWSSLYEIRLEMKQVGNHNKDMRFEKEKHLKWSYMFKWRFRFHYNSQ